MIVAQQVPLTLHLDRKTAHGMQFKRHVPRAFRLRTQNYGNEFYATAIMWDDDGRLGLDERLSNVLGQLADAGSG